MCRKLLFLIAVLGLVSIAWADDPSPPDWRGEPGSTVSHWTYDDPPPLGPSGDPYPSEDSYPRIDAADSSSYVSHPDKADPDNYVARATEEFWDIDYPLIPSAAYENFAMQLWGDYEWTDTYKGRTGVLAPFNMGSWDIFNFWSDPPQPEKDIQIQMTWAPYTITTGWYETTDALWNYFDWPEPETWDDEGTLMAGATLNLDQDYYDMDETLVNLGPYYDTTVEGFNFELEYMPADGYLGEWGEGYSYLEQLEPDEIIDHGDGWETWKFAFSVEPNPYVEFIGIFPVGAPEGDPYEMWASEYEGPLADYPADWPPPMYTWMDGEVEYCWTWLEALPDDWDVLWGDPMETWMNQDYGPAMIALDQIDIDTICIPEPVTISLLGLGGLALIRRKRR